MKIVFSTFCGTESQDNTHLEYYNLLKYLTYVLPNKLRQNKGQIPICKVWLLMKFRIAFKRMFT